MEQMNLYICDELIQYQYTPFKTLVFDQNKIHNNLRTLMYIRINNFFLPIFSHVTN